MAEKTHTKENRYLSPLYFQRSESFDHLTAVSAVGLSPALATCETSQVLLAGVSGGFPGVLPFCPTYQLIRLNMS